MTVVHACRQCGSKGRTHVMGLEAVLGHNDGVDLEQCVLVSQVDVRVEHRVLVVVVLNALRGGGAWARGSHTSETNRIPSHKLSPTLLLLALPASTIPPPPSSIPTPYPNPEQL